MVASTGEDVVAVQATTQLKDLHLQVGDGYNQLLVQRLSAKWCNAQQNYFTPALFLIHKRLSIYINFILNICRTHFYNNKVVCKFEFVVFGS